MTIIIIYHYLSFFPDIGPVTPDSGTPCVWDLMSKAKKKKKYCTEYWYVQHWSSIPPDLNLMQAGGPGPHQFNERKSFISYWSYDSTV